MVKVEGGNASRELLPEFLKGLAPESLSDLSWTDPALGVQGAGWWPEENGDVELGTNKKWGAEVLTLDAERKVVIVTHKQVNMTATEKAERDAIIAEQWAVQIAARRYVAEMAGTTVQGMAIATDDRSQGLITGAALAAMLDAHYTIKWKTAEGFVELTGAQVIGVASAVRAYVQACFDREADLLAAVADGSITEAMVGETWP